MTHDVLQVYATKDQRGECRRAGGLRLSRPWLVVLALTMMGLGLAFAGHGLFMRAKAALAQVLLERAWQTTMTTGLPTKAWRWADTHPVAKISFPSLGRSAIVLEEAGGEALAFGPAHVAASPLPGEIGTSVIGGHRDTHFNFIKDLKPGDEIDITTKRGKAVRYRMVGSAIVHPQSSGISIVANRPRLALVTCYPFEGIERSTLRYVVFAEAVSAGLGSGKF